GKLEHPLGILGGQVDTATALGLTPVVVPVRAVNSVRPTEVLSPGHRTVHQIVWRDHRCGHELTGDREPPCRGGCGLERVPITVGRATAARGHQRYEYRARALERYEPPSQNAYLDPRLPAPRLLFGGIGFEQRRSPGGLVPRLRNDRFVFGQPIAVLRLPERAPLDFF